MPDLTLCYLYKLIPSLKPELLVIPLPDTLPLSNDDKKDKFIHLATEKQVPHLVNVTHTYTSTDATTGSSRNAKPAAPKKKSTTMLGNIALEGVTRVDFIKAFLSIHNLHTSIGDLAPPTLSPPTIQTGHG